MTTSRSIGRAVAYESCRCAPSDFACPRASRVQSKQGSGSSRRARDTATTMLHHIAANRHHYEQSKLCHMQLSQND